MGKVENVLVLATFDSESAADEAAAALTAWDKANDQIKLGGIGVLAKDEFGEIKQHKIGPRQGKKGVGVGMLLGVVAAIPTGGISLLPGLVGGAVGGGVVGSLFRKGFNDLSKADAERISHELDTGHAVVGVLAPPDQADDVLEKLAAYGGQTEAHGVSDEELQETAQIVGDADQANQPPQATGQTTPPQV